MESELKGKIITLRETCPEDYTSLQEILNDRETMESLGSYFQKNEWSMEMVKERYEYFLNERIQGLGLTYSVVETSLNKVVGNCGFKNINHSNNEAEFGIILHKSAWGRGIAQECFSLCLTYGFDQIGLQRIYFLTNNLNSRMKNFFSKLGIHSIGCDSLQNLSYEIKKKEWQTGEISRKPR